MFDWVGEAVTFDVQKFGQAKGWEGEPVYIGQLEHKGALFLWPFSAGAPRLVLACGRLPNYAAPDEDVDE